MVLPTAVTDFEPNFLIGERGTSQCCKHWWNVTNNMYLNTVFKYKFEALVFYLSIFFSCHFLLRVWTSDKVCSAQTLLLRGHGVVTDTECVFASSCWNKQGHPWKRHHLDGSICVAPNPVPFSISGASTDHHRIKEWVYIYKKTIQFINFNIKYLCFVFNWIEVERDF